MPTRWRSKTPLETCLDLEVVLKIRLNTCLETLPLAVENEILPPIYGDSELFQCFERLQKLENRLAGCYVQKLFWLILGACITSYKQK